MSAESKRTLIAGARRIAIAGLVLLIIWLGLFALRGAISTGTIELMNQQMSAQTPRPPPLPLNPWTWDWSKSLFTGKTVAEALAPRTATTIGLMAFGGLVSLVLAGILLLIGMLIARATNLPGWLARTRSVLGLIVVSGGASLPAYLVGAFLAVYAVIWFGTGSQNRLSPGQNLFWSIVTLSLLPAWLLVQHGLAEMKSFGERQRIFDPQLWRHLGISLAARLLQLAGAVAVVTVFVEQTWLRPGLGNQMVTAVNLRDFPVLFGVVWTFAAIVVVAKLAGDLVEIAYRRLGNPQPELRPIMPATEPRGIPRWWLYVCLGLVVVSLLVAIAAPLIAPQGYNEMVLGARLQAPSAQHLLGTDNLGRDILSRLVYGLRTDILGAVLAVLIMAVLAVAWAMLAAHVRKGDNARGDTGRDLVMLPRDILCALPWLVLILFGVAFIGMASGPVPPILFSVPATLVISLALLPRAAGIMREASLMPAGGPWLKPLLKSIPVMLVFAVAGGILYLATISYLGLGVYPPAPELGSMLAGPSRRYMLQAPWMAAWPAVAIMVLLTSWVMAGQMLSDKLGFNNKALWSKIWE